MIKVSAGTSQPASDQLIRVTARIECANAAGETLNGTCFFFLVELDDGRQAPILVTNRHVIEGQTTAIVYLTIRDVSPLQTSREIVPFRIDSLHHFAIYHPTPEVDLAAILFAPIAQILRLGGKTAEYVALRSSDIVTAQTLEDCRAFEDLIMIGYPNGIWDQTNNRPILRRASTATPIFERYNNQAKFLIDCACFPGSSGSPVFLFNDGMYATKQGSTLGATRVALAGVLHAGFLHLTKGRVAAVNVAALSKLEAEITVPNSIGICIKASEIDGLIQEVRGKADRMAA